MNTLNSKYELKSKKHRQRIIKNWVIVTVVAAIRFCCKVEFIV